MIRSFTDLEAWKSAHVLALQIYKITDNFPKSEVFGLSSQLRRAAVSVGSNLAEGFGRKGQKDKEHFYTMASGSLYELKSQLLLVRDLGYCKSGNFEELAGALNNTHKLVNGLLRTHRNSNV